MTGGRQRGFTTPRRESKGRGGVGCAPRVEETPRLRVTIAAVKEPAQGAGKASWQCLHQMQRRPPNPIATSLNTSTSIPLHYSCRFLLNGPTRICPKKLYRVQADTTK